jgi:hypothetical protein
MANYGLAGFSQGLASGLKDLPGQLVQLYLGKQAGGREQKRIDIAERQATTAEESQRATEAHQKRQADIAEAKMIIEAGNKLGPAQRTEFIKGALNNYFGSKHESLSGIGDKYVSMSSESQKTFSDTIKKIESKLKKGEFIGTELLLLEQYEAGASILNYYRDEAKYQREAELDKAGSDIYSTYTKMITMAEENPKFLDMPIDGSKGGIELPANIRTNRDYLEHMKGSDLLSPEWKEKIANFDAKMSEARLKREAGAYTVPQKVDDLTAEYETAMKSFRSAYMIGDQMGRWQMRGNLSDRLAGYSTLNRMTKGYISRYKELTGAEPSVVEELKVPPSVFEEWVKKVATPKNREKGAEIILEAFKSKYGSVELSDADALATIDRIFNPVKKGWFD